MKIEIKGVSKKFKDEFVLQDVDLTFESGKIYALIGKNGSGKSVLLKMICGFYIPTSGEILFNNKNIIKEKKFPPETRALIENPSFIPNLTGLENLELLASIQNVISKSDIISTIKTVNLEKDKDKKYSKYSLGMKQKLGLAQVLMENPTVMIFDEPFNGIEEKTTKEIRELLKLKKSEDKLIILASHIKEDITDLADEVYKFDDGKVIKIQ